MSYNKKQTSYLLLISKVVPPESFPPRNILLHRFVGNPKNGCCGTSNVVDDCAKFVVVVVLVLLLEDGVGIGVDSNVGSII